MPNRRHMFKLLLHLIVLFVALFSIQVVYVAGKSVMVEVPRILNKEASATYSTIYRVPRRSMQLRHQVEQVMSEEKWITKKSMLPGKERRYAFGIIQKLVHKITTNDVRE